MRRPLLLVCFGMALGIVLGYYGAPVWLILCGAVFTAALFFWCLSGRVQTVWLCVTAAFVLGFFHMYFCEGFTSAYEESEGSVVSAEGVITKVEVKDGYVAATLNADEQLIIRIYTDDEYDFASPYRLVGRRAVCTGTVVLPEGRRNPGGFDYRLWLKARGVRAILKVSKYRFVAYEVKMPVLSAISAAKGKFLAAARENMPEREFSVMAGLLFGEKSYMDEDLYSEFQELGIAHVLAVSGLHVGLLYTILLKLSGGVKGWRTTGIMLAVLFVYAALSNFSVSVLRASFMIALNLLSFHIRRRYDSVCAASLCALFFMSVNPYQLFDSGFQLSFVAAYTMGVALPWGQLKLTQLADRLSSDFIYKAGELVMPCLMIQLGMVPLLLFDFQNYSWLSLLLNPLAAALAALLLAAGLAFFGIFLLLPAAGAGLALAAGPASGFAGLLALLSELGMKLGGGLALPAPPVSVVVLYYLGFFWFFSESRYILNRREKKKTLAIIASGIAFLGCFAPWALGITGSPLPWHYNDYALCFVDVGQGDCIHIQIGGKNILIDGGGKYNSNIAEDTLQPYLLKNGITHIDIAFVTHLDLDHSLGIKQLSEIMPVESMVFPAGIREDETAEFISSEKLYLSSGDTVQISDARFTVLSPDSLRLSGDNNNDCLVLLLEYEGCRFLFTGDLGEEGEASLLAAGTDLSADVLKVAHHGSKTSTSRAFLDACSPSFAVISCGKNNAYGHPAERVVDLLSNSAIIYSRTDSSGAVCLKKIKKGRMIFENAAKEIQWSIPSGQ